MLSGEIGQEAKFIRFYYVFPNFVASRKSRLHPNGPKQPAFVFGNTYLNRTFTEYVSNQYKHFDILTC